MPLSFWIINGKLAEQIQAFISDSRHSKSHAIIQKIKDIALSYELEIGNEPTFARVVLHIIEKTNADDKTKVSMIFDTANVTTKLRDLKIGSLNKTDNSGECL